MKEKLALAIAALMITSMAFAISTTSVSATHERTVSIDESTVKGSTLMVRTITITNNGPDAIDNVRIILPSGITDASPTILVSKDNQVEIETDNVVTLPAGTLIKLGSGAVTAVAGTSLTIPDNTMIRWQPVGDNVDGYLRENLTAQLNENFTFTIGAENATTSEDVAIADNENLVALVEDTQAVRLSGNKVMLPAGAEVQFINETSASLGADNKVKLAYDVNVELDDDNTINPPGDNDGRKFLAVSTATTSTIYMVSIGENVWINRTGTENIIIFKEDTEVVLAAANTVTLFADTEVIRAANENVTLPGGITTENQPKNWTQVAGTSVLPSGPSVEWVGDENNQIASGESLDFPFAFTSPGSGDYTIYVKTKDTKGVVVQTIITLTTDNVSPTIEEIAVSPEWAKASTEVTITVTASEPLAKLDNVMAAENNATENTQISMSPNADKTIWTGTYTTGDNENRDGTATIYVIGDQYEDLIGNKGTGDNTETFTVDRLAPTTPDLGGITGFPTSPTTTATWFIENEAMDNFLGSLVPLESGVVKIRVGTTVYDVTPSTSGYYSKSITLAEGTQEVGIQYIDRAGNAGEENAENITLDKTAPSIAWGTIAGEALVDGIQINDNAPKITLTISDAGLGVDNSAFAGDNTGYSVQLRYDNDTPIENLVNVLAHDNNVLAFENTISELTDNTYRIYVVAGDNQLMDNALIKFVIDTAAPGVPDVGAAYAIVSTMDTPMVVKDASRTIAGTTEAGATITVYGTVDTTETVLATTTAESQWTVTFTLTAGSITKIEISATDVAGNEGSRTLYGWMLADASAPTVTLAEVPETTDKSSITISGTVSKDAWEDWSDITLTVQVGVGRVPVPIGAGGSYNYSLTLSEGPNTIVVQATDEIGNTSVAAHAVVERVVTPWSIYAIILVIVALILAAIAIFGGPRIWKR